VSHCNLYLPIQAHSPQQNGVAKWKNRTIFDRAQSMTLNCNLPKNIWTETINVTNYLINRSPNKTNSGISPKGKFSVKVLNLSHFCALREFLFFQTNKVD
jgi:hypothetical protein